MAIKTIRQMGICKDHCPKNSRHLLFPWLLTGGDVMDDWSHLKVIPLKGAMTNEVYQISWPTTRKDPEGFWFGFMVKELTSSSIGMKSPKGLLIGLEIQTFECVSKKGNVPRLLVRFPEGRIEEFIHARTLSASHLRDPEILRLVGAELRDFYNPDMAGVRNTFFWDRIRKWLKEAKHFCSVEDAEEFCVSDLEEEVSVLENALPSEDQHIGLYHNDLQIGNIMMDEETKAITLIDYEYASYNPFAYDIANHFCEMAANYDSDTPHILDYRKYPGLEERHDFLQNYLTYEGYCVSWLLTGFALLSASLMLFILGRESPKRGYAHQV